MVLEIGPYREGISRSHKRLLCLNSLPTKVRYTPCAAYRTRFSKTRVLSLRLPLPTPTMYHVVTETAAAPSITEEQLDKLVAEAEKAKMKAYAPYSKFRVGASLLGDDGIIYSGCNVENCSYGLTVCAERIAVFQAVSKGTRSFRAVVVTTDVTDSFIYPCGACRQVMSEFGNFDVYCVRPNGKISRTTVADLLPFAFSSKDLGKGRGNGEKDVL